MTDILMFAHQSLQNQAPTEIWQIFKFAEYSRAHSGKTLVCKANPNINKKHACAPLLQNTKKATIKYFFSAELNKRLSRNVYVFNELIPGEQL